MSQLRADRCPVCGDDNDCAVVRCGPGACASCWCAGVAIDPATLARIPAAARGRACLCRTCASHPDSPSPKAPDRAAD